MPSRYYANGQAKTLSGAITNVSTSLVVNNVTGLPTSFPYTIVIDRGTALEDVMDVTNAVGTTLTVTRSVDGYTAQGHALGARVEHVTTARDYTEFQTKLDDRVTLTGAQTIAGVKTFSSTPIVPGLTVNGVIYGQASTMAGDVLIVGNDSKIVDSNTAHMFSVQSMTDTTRGGLLFGSAGPSFLSSGTTLTLTGALTVTGAGSFQGVPIGSGVLTGFYLDGTNAAVRANAGGGIYLQSSSGSTTFALFGPSAISLNQNTTVTGSLSATSLNINGNNGLITIPFHLGGSVPVAIAAPKYIVTRPMNIHIGYWRLGAGTMTPAIYKNGSNVAQGGSVTAGGSSWDFADINCVAGDYIQLGATAADASAAEFSLTLLAVPT